VSVALEVVLVNGERRTIELPGPTDSVANALDRLDAWVKTTDGGWVQKSHIVEVRRPGADGRPGAGSSEELERLSHAAGALADQAHLSPARP
jgi:hypothetical protein